MFCVKFKKAVLPEGRVPVAISVVPEAKSLTVDHWISYLLLSLLLALVRVKVMEDERTSTKLIVGRIGKVEVVKETNADAF